MDGACGAVGRAVAYDTSSNSVVAIFYFVPTASKRLKNEKEAENDLIKNCYACNCFVEIHFYTRVDFVNKLLQFVTRNEISILIGHVTYSI